MNIEARKYHMIQRIMRLDEKYLSKMEAFMEDESFDPDVEKIMIARALQSEKDIEEGRVFTLEEIVNRYTHKQKTND